ncbi:MAG: beta-phosphoglucomutase [Bacteroidia bacterium]|nr:beta-phosphoglucomutase [Bacteroidia bacterium]
MKIKACLFDLDGVVVDTARYHYMAWKKIASDLSFDFSEHDNERLKGISRMESLDILLEIGKIKVDLHTKEELAATKNSLYISYIQKMTPDEILPGVIRFLDELHNGGILVALGSASKNAMSILDKINIAQKFDAVIDGNKVSKAKPNPEVFLKGAAELGIEPNDCLVFEDAQAGIDAARNGGMHIIGIGQPENLKNADFVIPGFETMRLDQLISWYS